jgi:hypothetical protein
MRRDRVPTGLAVASTEYGAIIGVDERMYPFGRQH